MLPGFDGRALQSSQPADMRINNLLCVLSTLRQAETLSRSDLARLTHLGVPTVHRLIGDLLACGLVSEIPARQDHGQKGRPAVLYRTNDSMGLLAGVDFGNEMARFALASATGHVLASRSERAARLAPRLPDSIAEAIGGLLASIGAGPDQLAGAGIGVAAVVEPDSFILRSPPKHRHLNGLPLGQLVEAKLGCPVIVRQDDHFAAIAETSEAGTMPGADPLLVLEIGSGIGAAMIVRGISIMGAAGKFGRIASWPVVTPRRGVAKSNLGQSLVIAGLVEDYHRRGGGADVFNGETLFAAAAGGDEVADAVLAWAGREIAQVVIRLHLLCDPVAIVLGGGLARGFAILEPHLRPHLPAEIRLVPSQLGERTVVTGAILSALPFIEPFVLRVLQDSESRAPAGVALRKASA